MKYFAPLFVLFFLPQIAKADVVPQTCRIMRADDSAVPRNVAAELRGRHASTVEICQSEDPIDKGKIIGITMFLKPWHDRTDACVVETYDRSQGGIGRAASADVGWNRGRVMMLAMPSASCPWQGDGRYIATADVSPGLFMELDHYWRNLGESRKFDAEIAALPEDVRKLGGGRLLREMRARFLSKDRPAIDTVRLAPIWSYNSGYDICAPWKGVESLCIRVELMPGGFRMRNVELIIP